MLGMILFGGMPGAITVYGVGGRARSHCNESCTGLAQIARLGPTL
jgi:hypothetical protein